MTVIEIASHRKQPVAIDTALLARLNQASIRAKRQLTLTGLAEAEHRADILGFQESHPLARASGESIRHRFSTPSSDPRMARLRALSGREQPRAAFAHPRLRMVAPIERSPQAMRIEVAVIIAVWAMLLLVAALHGAVH